MRVKYPFLKGYFRFVEHQIALYKRGGWIVKPNKKEINEFLCHLYGAGPSPFIGWMRSEIAKYCVPIRIMQFVRLRPDMKQDTHHDYGYVLQLAGRDSFLVYSFTFSMQDNGYKTAVAFVSPVSTPYPVHYHELAGIQKYIEYFFKDQRIEKELNKNSTYPEQIYRLHGIYTNDTGVERPEVLSVQTVNRIVGVKA